MDYRPLLIATLLLTGCGSTAQEVHAPSASTDEIRLFFVNPSLPAFATTCGAVSPVSRGIAAGTQRERIDAAMRLLLNGVLPEEARQGLTSDAFFPGEDDPSDLRPLLSYYRGATMQGTTVTLDFAQPAIKYLNGTACMQEAVKTPIEETLTQFPGITNVQYSIDGTVITGWDA